MASLQYSERIESLPGSLALRKRGVVVLFLISTILLQLVIRFRDDLWVELRLTRAISRCF